VRAKASLEGRLGWHPSRLVAFAPSTSG
jgi:hypothetical protein